MASMTKYLLGEFELDPGSYSLVRDSVPVAISRKRFEVLLHLVEQRHRVVTRRELVERFWDGHEVYEENLTKCISEVRRALDDQHKPHRFVETLPAVGYRYIGPLEERARPQHAPAPVAQPQPVATKPETETFIEEEAVAVQAKTAVTPAPLQPRPSGGTHRARWAAILSLAVLITLFAGALIFYPNRLNSSDVDPRAIRSLAILPFTPLGDQNRDEFLELGMADALITKLSSIRQVAVMPMGSVRKYTKLIQDPIAAGNELKVESVLEGSIQRLPDRVRVTVRLLRVADGAAIWAETFDDSIADIFALQDSISEKVAIALAVRLSLPEKVRITRRYTENREAYQFYQMGRYFWNKRTQDGVKKGIEFFELAIKEDSNYALAYAGLADSYVVANFSLLPPREVFPKAKQAALKALEIDGTLAEPHAALAFATMVYDRDWLTAEREFRRALDLNPYYGEAHEWYALSLAATGRIQEAKTEAELAKQTDPTSLAISVGAAWVSFLARDYDKTIAQCDQVIEMEPSFGLAYFYRGLAYEQKHMFEKAIADLETAKPSQTRPTVLGALGHAYAKAGNHTKARKMLRDLEELSQKGYFPGYQTALIHIGLGENDEAFALIEKSYKERYPAMIHVNVEPRLDPIRSDPRFKALVQRIGL
jgi:TolB-like protein/DNA-binding winged helix-turn-helix (wHTH) protein/Flp pilus assembly protein TadD